MDPFKQLKLKALHPRQIDRLPHPTGHRLPYAAMQQLRLKNLEASTAEASILPAQALGALVMTSNAGLVEALGRSDPATAQQFIGHALLYGQRLAEAVQPLAPAVYTLEQAS